MIKFLRKDDLHIDKHALIEKLRVNEDDLEEFNLVYEKCMEIACAKYILQKKEITAITEEYVEIEGILVKSKIAVKNMKNTGYAYPYVVTCGRELYDYSCTISDPFVNYWVDILMEQVLYLAINRMDEDFKKTYNIHKTASVNPGSTIDWPISGQTELFLMLSDEIDQSGIKLTPTFLMLPNKSASGIMFATDEDYMNCQYCKRKNCPNRRKDFIGI